MKTQKWVQAKKNAYDGDDWGDYDEYDEYGAEPSQPAAPPARGYGDRYDPPGRSFTDPHRQGPPQLGRRYVAVGAMSLPRHCDLYDTVLI